MDLKKIGNFGEKIACYYLEKKGYKILDRNYSRKWSGGPQKGEIDIITEKDKVISFVEVKTSAFSGGFMPARLNFARQNFGGPEDRVDFRKQKQLIKLAQDWLVEKKIPLDSKWQIDVISIKIDLNTKKAKIRHFKNAVF